MKHTVLNLTGAALLLTGSLLFSQQTQAQLFSTSVIVDNSDPGFSASTDWNVSRARDQYGVDYRYRPAQAVADPATWTADLKMASASSVTVSAFWPTVPGSNPAAPYIVYHASGTTTVLVNQQTNGGKFNTLGTFNLNPGNNEVKLSCWTSAQGNLIADAIRWKW